MTEYLFLAAAIVKTHKLINKVRSVKVSEQRSYKKKKRKRKVGNVWLTACCIRQRQIAAKSPDPESTALAESDSLSGVLLRLQW
jgi:hypothetical protein